MLTADGGFSNYFEPVKKTLADLAARHDKLWERLYFQ